MCTSVQQIHTWTHPNYILSTIPETVVNHLSSWMQCCPDPLHCHSPHAEARIKGKRQEMGICSTKACLQITVSSISADWLTRSLPENKVANEKRMWSRGCREINKVKSKGLFYFIELYLQFDLAPNKRRVWELNWPKIDAIIQLFTAHFQHLPASSCCPDLWIICALRCSQHTSIQLQHRKGPQHNWWDLSKRKGPIFIHHTDVKGRSICVFLV